MSHCVSNLTPACLYQCYWVIRCLRSRWIRGIGIREHVSCTKNGSSHLHSKEKDLIWLLYRLYRGSNPIIHCLIYNHFWDPLIMLVKTFCFQKQIFFFFLDNILPFPWALDVNSLFFAAALFACEMRNNAEWLLNSSEWHAFEGIYHSKMTSLMKVFWRML